MASNSTSIAVGCAVGIPCFVAFCVAFIFWIKTRKRFHQEDLEFSRQHEVDDIERDLSYSNIDQLKLEKDTNFNTNSEPSEDSDQSRHNGQHDEDESEKKAADVSRNDSKKQRYIPAYRKKFKSSITNLNNSRNSSISNLHNAGAQIQGSNSSINSNTTNQTDLFYNNSVPVLDGARQTESSNNSLDLARTLQQPTPSYSKKSSSVNRSASVSTSQNDEEDYDLKNNYKVENEHEIQEEDQYENEFTNYSENKRAYIDSLRPK